ncbi:MAG: PAS domain S-box protein [Chloroflexaceae bacterium]|nr:PAS domain S-box protein [Chloroflexaceae bacterium]
MQHDTSTVAALAEENAQLCERVAQLEQMLQTQQHTITALEAERDTLIEAFHRIPAFLHLTAPDGSVVFSNQAFRACFGDPQTTPPCCPFCHEPLNEAGAGYAHHRECRYRQGQRADEMPWELSLSDRNVYQVYEYLLHDRKHATTEDDNNDLILLFGIDITERHRIADRLKSLNEELRCQANELRIFKTLIENMPDGVGVVNLHGMPIYANPALFRIHDYGDATLESNMSKFFPRVTGAQMAKLFEEIKNWGIWNGELTGMRKDGSTFPVLSTNFLIQDDAGEPHATVGIFRDISDQKRAEEERLMLQQQIIEAQKAVLRELSTPLLPLTEHTLVLPLIGSIDSGRAQQIIETLLEGVHQHRAQSVIIDVTGLKTGDTHVAAMLLQATQAVTLLGAQVLLTGVQPQIAANLVHMDADVSNITTCSTLQQGIALVLQALSPRRNRSFRSYIR